MINLSKRSYKKELLDQDNIPFADIQQNMKELNTINTNLGGHAVSIAGLQQLIGPNMSNKPFSICEIGCGGGDNLDALNTWAKKKNIKVTFTGIDIKPACIEFARQQYPHLNAVWITSGYEQVLFGDSKPDIIFSSLFCHHFDSTQLQQMLQWMQQHSSTGFFINDLHRHWLAYGSIKLITRYFSSSYLVKNDAPLSVARGFKKKEWKTLLQNAGIQKFTLQWKWAFRHLIVYQHD